MRTIYRHATVYAASTASEIGTAAYEILPNGAVKVENGKITEIIRDADAWSEAEMSGYELVDLRGNLLVPGFVDVHVHGGGGYDAMYGEEAHIQGMSRFHARHGTTSMLVTTLTADRSSIEQAIVSTLDAIEQGVDGADIAGIHLEGPFISPARCGAQHSEYIREPSIEELAAYVRLAKGSIKLLTIAPERPQAMEVIRYAVQQGITVSIGHTDATLGVIREAVRNGAQHVTHLFNGMRPLHHREPGTAGAAVMLDELAVELICDGYHVHPELIDFVFRVKPRDQVVLVTDAMSAAGLPDGDDYDLGGLPCYKRDGQVRLKSTGDLAGSCLTMDAALRHALNYTGLELVNVLPALTINPARQAGISDRKGSIAPGMDADLIVLNSSHEVMATYVRGRLVYERG